MWQRTSNDPLGRLLYSRYGLHVLSRPREDMTVFHLLPVSDGRAGAPGKLSTFLGALFDLPAVKAGERLADISGTTSDGVSLAFGFDFLEGFLSLIGAQAVIKALSAAFKKSNTKALKLRFGGATRDYLEDPFELELRLRNFRFAREDSLMRPGCRYYIVTAVHRSDQISFTAVDEHSAQLDVSAEVAAIGGANAAIKSSGNGEMTAESDTSLVYGVELSELVHNERRNRLELAMTKGYVQVRTGEQGQLPGSARSMIGGPDDSMRLRID